MQELDTKLMIERALQNERIAKKQRKADIAAEEAQKIELARLEAQAIETAAEELRKKEAKTRKGKFGSNKAKKEDLKSTGTQAKKKSAASESKKQRQVEPQRQSQRAALLKGKVQRKTIQNLSRRLQPQLKRHSRVHWKSHLEGLFDLLSTHMFTIGRVLKSQPWNSDWS